MAAGTALVMAKVADRASQDAAAPSADPTDADHVEDVERLRRQSADLDTQQSSAASDAATGDGAEYGRG